MQPDTEEESFDDVVDNMPHIEDLPENPMQLLEPMAEDLDAGAAFGNRFPETIDPLPATNPGGGQVGGQVGGMNNRGPTQPSNLSPSMGSGLNPLQMRMNVGVDTNMNANMNMNANINMNGGNMHPMNMNPANLNNMNTMHMHMQGQHQQQQRHPQQQNRQHQHPQMQSHGNQRYQPQHQRQPPHYQQQQHQQQQQHGLDRAGNPMALSPIAPRHPAPSRQHPPPQHPQQQQMQQLQRLQPQQQQQQQNQLRPQLQPQPQPQQQEKKNPQEQSQPQPKPHQQKKQQPRPRPQPPSQQQPKAKKRKDQQQLQQQEHEQQLKKKPRQQQQQKPKSQHKTQKQQRKANRQASDISPSMSRSMAKPRVSAALASKPAKSTKSGFPDLETINEDREMNAKKKKKANPQDVNNKEAGTNAGPPADADADVGLERSTAPDAELQGNKPAVPAPIPWGPKKTARSSRKSAPTPEELIPFVPTKVDVISTKLRTWNIKHAGNIYYTKIIQLAMQCLQSERPDEVRLLARCVVHEICTVLGGRFLKLKDGEKDSTMCVVMTTKTRLSKVIHAIRTAKFGRTHTGAPNFKGAKKKKPADAMAAQQTNAQPGTLASNQDESKGTGQQQQSQQSQKNDDDGRQAKTEIDFAKSESDFLAAVEIARAEHEAGDHTLLTPELFAKSTIKPKKSPGAKSRISPKGASGSSKKKKKTSKASKEDKPKEPEKDLSSFRQVFTFKINPNFNNRKSTIRYIMKIDSLARFATHVANGSNSSSTNPNAAIATASSRNRALCRNSKNSDIAKTTTGETSLTPSLSTLPTSATRGDFTDEPSLHYALECMLLICNTTETHSDPKHAYYVLDEPLPGYTEERRKHKPSDSEDSKTTNQSATTMTAPKIESKEFFQIRRLLQHRYAATTRSRISPIEFTRRLLRLWNNVAILEQIDLTAPNADVFAPAPSTKRTATKKRTMAAAAGTTTPGGPKKSDTKKKRKLGTPNMKPHFGGLDSTSNASTPVVADGVTARTNSNDGNLSQGNVNDGHEHEHPMTTSPSSTIAPQPTVQIDADVDEEMGAADGDESRLDATRPSNTTTAEIVEIRHDKEAMVNEAADVSTKPGAASKSSPNAGFKRPRITRTEMDLDDKPDAGLDTGDDSETDDDDDDDISEDDDYEEEDDVEDEELILEPPDESVIKMSRTGRRSVQKSRRSKSANKPARFKRVAVKTANKKLVLDQPPRTHDLIDSDDDESF